MATFSATLERLQFLAMSDNVQRELLVLAERLTTAFHWTLHKFISMTKVLLPGAGCLHGLHRLSRNHFKWGKLGDLPHGGGVKKGQCDKQICL